MSVTSQIPTPFDKPIIKKIDDEWAQIGNDKIKFQPTGELRWLDISDAQTIGAKLQQKWIARSSPYSSVVATCTDWRDVPTVKQNSQG